MKRHQMRDQFTFALPPFFEGFKYQLSTILSIQSCFSVHVSFGPFKLEDELRQSKKIVVTLPHCGSQANCYLHSKGTNMTTHLSEKEHPHLPNHLQVPGHVIVIVSRTQEVHRLINLQKGSIQKNQGSQKSTNQNYL